MHLDISHTVIVSCIAYMLASSYYINPSLHLLVYEHNYEHWVLTELQLLYALYHWDLQLLYSVTGSH